jgi:hypothetical protein
LYSRESSSSSTNDGRSSGISSKFLLASIFTCCCGLLQAHGDQSGLKSTMLKCRLHLLGLPLFWLIVDYQSLVTVLDKYNLDVVENPKLQWFKERLSPFVFTTERCKGRDHAVPYSGHRSRTGTIRRGHQTGTTVFRSSGCHVTAGSHATSWCGGGVGHRKEYSAVTRPPAWRLVCSGSDGCGLFRPHL